MKTIILGAGSVGVQIARQLIAEGRDVVLIDRDEETTRDAVNSLDCMVVRGEAGRKETYLEAGVSSTDVFVSVTESDEMNIIACGLVASEFGVSTTIARVRNEEYTEAIASGRSFMGITHVVNPDIEAAQAVLRTIEFGVISEIMPFRDSSFEMRTLIVQEGSPAEGKSLTQIKVQSGRKFLAAVIIRQLETIIPRGDTTIRAQDQLYLIGTAEELDACLPWFGKARLSPKKILLVGGGRIGTHILDGLVNRQKAPDKPTLIERLKGMIFPGSRRPTRNVTVLEADYEESVRLSRNYPEALVKNADVSDDPVLEEEDLPSYDLLIAATGNQELNLVTSAYAKSLGMTSTIVLVRKSSYLTIANHLALDAAISLNNSIANSILRLIRTGNVRRIYGITEYKIEFIELVCVAGGPFDRVLVQNSRLPKDTLILFIIREGENLLPTGSLEIRSGDRLIMVTTPESLKKLETTAGAAR